MSLQQKITFLIVLPIFLWGMYWVIHDVIEYLEYLGWIRRNKSS